MRFFKQCVFVLLISAPAISHAQIQPGQWEAVVTIHSIDMPGAPPQAAAMMKGKTTRHSYCITAEEAKRGPQEMLKQQPSCRFGKYVMAQGTIATEMTCRQNGETMAVRASGSYTPTSFNVTSSAMMTGRMSMRMTSTSTGKRIGACSK